MINYKFLLIAVHTDLKKKKLRTHSVFQTICFWNDVKNDNLQKVYCTNKYLFRFLKKMIQDVQAVIFGNNLFDAFDLDF